MHAYSSSCVVVPRWHLVPILFLPSVKLTLPLIPILLFQDSVLETGSVLKTVTAMGLSSSVAHTLVELARPGHRMFLAGSQQVQELLKDEAVPVWFVEERHWADGQYQHTD